MIRLQGSERLFISDDLWAFTKKLDTDGTVPRMVDFLFLGFGYAIKQQLSPADPNTFARQPLIPAMNIDQELMLSVEMTAQWYAQKRGISLPEDTSELLVLICSIGISGCRALQKRWEVRRKSQIQMDIMQISNPN